MMGIPSMAIAIAAVFLAMAGGMALAMALVDRIHRFAFASSVLSGEVGSKTRMLLQKGVPFLDGLASTLISKVPLIAESSERMRILAEEHELQMTKEAVVSSLLGLAMVFGTVCFLVSRSGWFALAASIAVLLAVMLIAKSWGEKQDMELREQIPDAIRSIGMSFRSGRSLPQTLKASSLECKGHLGKLFASSADRLELGAPTSEALKALCGDSRVPELSFIAVALDIQHQSGGSIGPVLDSATETVEGELKLMRDLRIQTAQAKLSATIVTVMPFILIALFSMMSPDFLSPFFASPMGVILLLAALSMQLAGVLIVRRMLKIGVG